MNDPISTPLAPPTSENQDYPGRQEFIIELDDLMYNSYSHRWEWAAGRQRSAIELDDLPGNCSSLKLTGWDAGISCRRIVGDKEREAFSDPFGNTRFPCTSFDDERFQPWIATIPKRVITHLRHWKYNPFGILLLVNRSQYARELFENHPVLFGLAYIVFSWAAHRKKRNDEEAFFSLCQQKRTNILKTCHLPATESAVKLLRKVDAKCFSAYDRRDIYNPIHSIFQLEDYALLNHCQRLSLEMLASVVSDPELLHSKFILNWDWEITWSHDHSRMVEDIFRMWDVLNISNWARLKQCQNTLSLSYYHDCLVNQINGQRGRIAFSGDTTLPPNRVYPSPPLAGNEFIVPIQNTGALQHESQVQRHCVASYHADIAAGDYYVYQVLAPERATLGIIAREAKAAVSWQIDQLKGFANKPVGHETEQAVLTWFNAQRPSPAANPSNAPVQAGDTPPAPFVPSTRDDYDDDIPF